MQIQKVTQKCQQEGGGGSCWLRWAVQRRPCCFLWTDTSKARLDKGPNQGSHAPKLKRYECSWMMRMICQLWWYLWQSIWCDTNNYDRPTKKFKVNYSENWSIPIINYYCRWPLFLNLWTPLLNLSCALFNLAKMWRLWIIKKYGWPTECQENVAFDTWGIGSESGAVPFEPR